MIVDEIKVVIDTNLPQNRDELVWIINNLGKYLFDKDLWEQNNIYKNEDENHPNVIEGILQLIEKVVQSGSLHHTHLQNNPRRLKHKTIIQKPPNQ